MQSANKIVNPGELMRLVEGWEPLDRPVHCSNCAHAIVSGDGIHNPTVHCARGYGRVISLWQLIRAQRPTGFRNAAECPSFESMDEVPV